MIRKVLAASVVFLAASLPYLSTLGSYFAGDDFGLVQHFADKPLLHFLTLFTRSWTGTIFGFLLDEFRPFTALSYQIGALSGAGAPAVQHLTLILIHALNSLLVMALAGLATGLPLPRAVFAGVVFAVQPLHVESVAWISGRAECIFGLFALSTFVAWAGWRRTGNRWLYVTSLVCLFGALFSKQNTIVIPVMLIAYDVMVAQMPWRRFRLHWKNYLPVVLLTGGYLLLRLFIFSDAVRSGALNAQAVFWFLVYQAMYVVMLLSGNSVIIRDDFHPSIVSAIPVAVLLLAGIAVLLRVAAKPLRDFASRLLFFGPVWWILTTAPMIVAGYATTRHLYFTLAGVSIVLAVLLELFWRSPKASIRIAGICAGAALLVFSLVRLEPGVRDWNTAANISEKMVRDIEREALAAPRGALLLLDAPTVFANSSLPPGRAIGRPWIWGFAMPFAAQPPFTRASLTEHVDFVVPPRVFCCPTEQWAREVTATIRRWSGKADRPPVRVMQWDPATGVLRSWSDAGNAALSSQVLQLARASDTADLNLRLGQIFGHALPTVY